MKSVAFERELPKGYMLARHLDAKDMKLGIILNLVAMAVWAAVMALGIVALYARVPDGTSILPLVVMGVLSGIIPMVIYIVLHELVHGAAYKKLTGEKLTFGMSWSCAFCGVPRIYTYRKTALVALLAPFVVFSVILLLGLVVTFVFSMMDDAVSVPVTVAYNALLFVFGMHLGGCSGDLYVTYLFCTKFKNERTLMRDTGPEQFFYVPDPDYVENEEGAISL